MFKPVGGIDLPGADLLGNRVIGNDRFGSGAAGGSENRIEVGAPLMGGWSSGANDPLGGCGWLILVNPRRCPRQVACESHA